MRIKFFFILLFLNLSVIESKCIEIETVFGIESIDDACLIELIESDAFQRLKGVDQHGIVSYCRGTPTFNRFDHSIGVFSLLKKFEAPFVEQVAGLLHDISHTVFSHVGDYLFQKDVNAPAYQDGIQAWFLKEQGIDKILEKYGYKIDDVLDDHPDFKGLEQPLPDLCADRIEYNLHTALVFDLMTKNEIQAIVKALNFQHGYWYFTDLEAARAFANLSLYFTKNFWGCGENSLCNEWFAEALKIALNHQILDLDEIHFSTDRHVLEKLLASQNSTIQELLEKCWHCESFFSTNPSSEHKKILFAKFRGVNPLIKINESFYRLTEIDRDFFESYYQLKEDIHKGLEVYLSNEQPLNSRCH